MDKEPLNGCATSKHAQSLSLFVIDFNANSNPASRASFRLLKKIVRRKGGSFRIALSP